MAAPTRAKRPKAPTTAAVQPPEQEQPAPGYGARGSRADDPAPGAPGGRLHQRAFTQLELEAFAWRARWAALEDGIRTCGKSPWDVLRDHGLTGSVGRRGRSADELVEIGSLWNNWATSGRSPHVRRSELGIVWEALSEGRDVPAEAIFEPNRDCPMTVEARIRTMQVFLGLERATLVGREQTLDVLRQADETCAAHGLSRLIDLPPKGPPRKRRPTRCY